MSSMLNYSYNAKNSWMSAMGYQKDEAEKYDSKENSEHLSRAKVIGSIFELMGPLYLSIFQQSKYMLPKVNLRTKMMRSKPYFYFMNFGNAGIKLEIMESLVRVRSVFVKPAVSRGHEGGLKHYNTLYNGLNLVPLLWRQVHKLSLYPILLILSPYANNNWYGKNFCIPC